MACTQFQNLFAYLFPIIFMRVTRDAQKNLKAATAQFCHAFGKDFHIRSLCQAEFSFACSPASNSGNGTLMKFATNQKAVN
jgi:hypothetical protein